MCINACLVHDPQFRSSPSSSPHMVLPLVEERRSLPDQKNPVAAIIPPAQVLPLESTMFGKTSPSALHYSRRKLHSVGFARGCATAYEPGYYTISLTKYARRSYLPAENARVAANLPRLATLRNIGPYIGWESYLLYNFERGDPRV